MQSPRGIGVDRLWQDVGLGLRQLRRSPGFAAAAILTLALGIGANTAVFALADAALFRPLPFPESDRLVMIWERRPNGFTSMVAPAEVREWFARSRAFEVMASMATGAGVSLDGPDGLPEIVSAQTVTARFFDVLGVAPLIGRPFAETDVTPSPTVVLISEALWRTRFGADPVILGRTLVINGTAATVIGVMPGRAQIVPPPTARAAATSGAAGLWLLAGRGGNAGADRAHYLHVVARVRRGLSLDAAASDMRAVAAMLERESPGTNTGHGAVVEPLRQALIGPEVRGTSLVLLAVVAFVLLLCCANIATLLMARTEARAGELAIRSVLGAGRARLVAQLLAESLVLAVGGGVLGAALAAAILGVAPRVVPPGLLPGAVMLAFDGRVLFFCAASALGAGLVFGMAPAWRYTGPSVARAAASDGWAVRGWRGLGGAIVAVEVAAVVLVLSGAGLLLRSWSALDRVDPGFRAQDAFTGVVTLMPPPVRYREADAVRRYYDAVARELEGRPEVRRVAWGSALPLAGWWFAQPVRVEGELPKPDAVADAASYHMVSPSYFETLGIDIVRGRAFAATDVADGVPVCIVSEAFARRYLAGRNPLAVRIAVPLMAFGPPRTVLRQVVGIARQVKGDPREPRDMPQLYVPLAQNTWWTASLVVVPASGAAEALAPLVRAAVARVDRGVPLRQIRSLEGIASDATARSRFRAVLVTMFGALGLALALVGLSGVLGHAVARRTREFGVRMALGARPGQVLALVLRDAARVVGTGATLGLSLSALLAPIIRTFLFGVAPTDPLTFVAVTAVLFVSASTAAIVPARRALRVDPAVTFRRE